jgi:hypothetical protein
MHALISAMQGISRRLRAEAQTGSGTGSHEGGGATYPELATTERMS